MRRAVAALRLQEDKLPEAESSFESLQGVATCAALTNFLREVGAPEELVLELRRAGWFSLAGLKYALVDLASRGREHAMLKQAGIDRMGDRYRICNGLHNLSGQVAKLIDVKEQQLLPLPKGSGPGSKLTHLIDYLQKPETRARVRKSFSFGQHTMSMITQTVVHTLAPTATSTPRPLPRRPSGARKPKLVLFIACHCANEARLVLLRRTLRSVKAQIGGRAACGRGRADAGHADAGRGDDWPLSGVFVSWSSESSQLAAVRSEFATCGIPGLRAFERDRAMSQLQHMATLLPEARRACGGGGGGGTEEELWVMFTDDDDLMHPARCAAYLAAVVTSPPEAQGVSAAWVARPLNAEDRVRSAGDVEALIEAGRVVRTPKEGSEKTGGGGSWDEYWNSCVRFEVLERFFAETCGPEARTCKYADIALFYCLKNSVPTLRFEPHALGFEAHWMHYYDKPIQLEANPREATAAASAGVTVIEGDEQRCETMVTSLRSMLEQVAREPTPTEPNKAAQSQALIVDLRSFLQAHDAKLREAEARPQNAEYVDIKAAGGSVSKNGPPRQVLVTPLLLLAVQFRSVLELFCANFVGAPHMPDDRTLLEMSRLIVVDTLASLGAPLNVAAVLQIFTLEPMLKSVLRMFGLAAGSSMNSVVQMR